MYVCIYQSPSYEQNVTQGQFLKCYLSGLSSEFSFSQTSCHTKVKDFSLSYYLHIAEGRIIIIIISRW